MDQTEIKRPAADTAVEVPYPPIGDHGLIGDCHSAALVARSGSITWCCLPRFDSDSCFAALLDRRRGGHFTIAPRGAHRSRRAYRGASLVLVTTFECEKGTVRLTDFFAMRRGGREHPRRELVRLVEGVTGRVRLCANVCPRFDYGEVEPWIYRCGDEAHIAVGSNTALFIGGNVPLHPDGRHDLSATFELRAGERAHILMRFVPPQDLDDATLCEHDAVSVQSRLEETLAWWDEWSSKLSVAHDPDGASIVRSAITLKALTFAPTGAIIAAPTTSLPEDPGGERNWDYRYSWIRDSVFMVHALSDLGCIGEADGFRRFVQRSAAGSAESLQPIYAIDGKRRLTEIALGHLEGWCGSRPVRIGNAVEKQFQSDVYGLLLELSWRWSERGNVPDPDYWAFLARIVEGAIANWAERDHGIWEIRDTPRHHVHSKVMCWAALHRGLQLAEAHHLPAPLERWRVARTAIRNAVMTHGVDHARGIFVSAFGRRDLDAALLLLPEVEFIDYRDPLMLRTTEAIRHELTEHGLVLRYRSGDGLPGDEGVFLPCSFWLVECLARQGRHADAQALYDHACACANDLGLFSEEYVPHRREQLGNFPQGLTHLAHVGAALALHETHTRPLK